MKIESGIPIPKRSGRKDYSCTDVLKSMTGGDSVVVATNGERNTFIAIANSLGIKVITEKAAGGYRVWVVGQKTPESPAVSVEDQLRNAIKSWVTVWCFDAERVEDQVEDLVKDILLIKGFVNS